MSQGPPARSRSPQGASSSREQSSRISPSPRGACSSRSPSPQGACSSRSPSPQEACRSPSPEEACNGKRTSPQRKHSGSWPGSKGKCPLGTFSQKKPHNWAGRRGQSPRRSPSPQGACRSPSPQGACSSRSLSPQGACSSRSPSPLGACRSPSPQVTSNGRQPSPQGTSSESWPGSTGKCPLSSFSRNKPHNLAGSRGQSSRSPSPQRVLSSRSPSPQGSSSSRSPSPEGACSSRSPSPQGACSRSPSPQGTSSSRSCRKKSKKSDNRIFPSVTVTIHDGIHRACHGLGTQEQEEALTADTNAPLGSKFATTPRSGPSPFVFGILVTNIDGNDSDLSDRIKSEFAIFGDITLLKLCGPSHQRFALLFYKDRTGQEKALASPNPIKTSFGEVTVTAWNKPPPPEREMLFPITPSQQGASTRRPSPLVASSSISIGPKISDQSNSEISPTSVSVKQSNGNVARASTALTRVEELPTALSSPGLPGSLYGVKVANFEKQITNMDIKSFLTETFMFYGKVMCVTVHGSGRNRYGLVFYKQKNERNRALTADITGPSGIKPSITIWGGLSPCIFGIVVTNIDYNVSKHPNQLKSEFSTFGDITLVQIRGPPQQRFALVFYKYQEGQEKALASPSPMKTTLGNVTVTAWNKPPPSLSEMQNEDSLKMLCFPIASTSDPSKKDGQGPPAVACSGLLAATQPPVCSGPLAATQPSACSESPAADPPPACSRTPAADPPPACSGPPAAVPTPACSGLPTVTPLPVCSDPPSPTGPHVHHVPPATRPPVCSGPPAGTQPPVHGVPPAATGSHVRHVPPAATRPPVWRGPPAATRPHVWRGAPAATRPPVRHVPPATIGPPVCHVPPAPTRPPMWRGAPAATRPPVWRGAPAAARPPVWSGQPAAVQPPVWSGQPAAVQPPVWSGPPAAVQPPVWSGPPAAIQPSVCSDPPVAVQHPVWRGSPVATVPSVWSGAPVAIQPPVWGGSPVANLTPVWSGPPVAISPTVYSGPSVAIQPNSLSASSETKYENSKPLYYSLARSHSPHTSSRDSRSQSPFSARIKPRHRRSRSRSSYVSENPSPHSRARYSRSRSPCSNQLYSERWHKDEKVSEQSSPPREQKSVGLSEVSASLQKASLILWINNLEETISSAEVRSAFKPFGEIEHIEIKEDSRNNGKQAFVQYSSPSSVARAIRHMDGTFLLNRKLQVDFAYPRQATNCLWVNGLRFSGVTKQYLTDVFRQFGHVQTLLHDPGKGAVLVFYKDTDSAVKAVGMKTIAGHSVELGFANHRCQLDFCHSMGY